MRREEAKAEKRQLFFMDAAHFVMQPLLGYLWCFVRVFIPSSSGRQRFNGLAVRNACTHQIISVTHDVSINAASVCALLTKIRASSTDSLPLTLVLDNACDQHGRRVIDDATALALELLFWPPDVPTLNLLERLWRFVRKTALATEDFDSFAPFKAAIQAWPDQSQTTPKKEPQSLETV